MFNNETYVKKNFFDRGFSAFGFFFFLENDVIKLSKCEWVKSLQIGGSVHNQYKC